KIISFFQGTLSALLCLATGLSQSEASGSKGSSGYPKKVTTLKKRPTKTPTTVAASTSTSRGTTTKPSKPRVKITKAGTRTTTTKAPGSAPALAESFGNLPADDLEFIKELDKQFKLHGNKIKIKVERDNSTTSGGGKNSKRTIEGDLGYGYSHSGYDYTPPKFMFYPYSQHDIPSGFAHPQPLPEELEEEAPPPPQQQPQQHHSPQKPHNHEHVTSVTIEPSYSYELKPQTSYETQAPQHTAPEQPQIDLPHDEAEAGGYQEPVIVLRIPGPAKYAAHLQTLLQQYLEIRAAQYLSLLQEAEQQQQHQPVHQQHVPEPQQYGPPEPVAYQPEVSYTHQLTAAPQPVQYAPIDDVYQSYKGRHQQQLQEPQYEPQQYYTPMEYQQPTQFYYAQPQSHLQQQPQLYLIAMAQPEPEQHQQLQQQHHHHHQQQQQEPIYVPEGEAPTAPEQQPEPEVEPEHNLPITENNPRPTHTKVIFNPYPYQQQQQHQQQQQQLQHQQHVQEQEQHAANLEEESQAEGDRPFNYHAHALKVRPGKRAAKPEPSQGTSGGDKRLQQIREYVREKLGAEMGSAVEYKTTQLLEG
ncbi:hypothetical protein KR026_009475, partial [Drosophila bipectinata]